MGCQPSQVPTNLALNMIQQTKSLQVLAFVGYGEASDQIVLPNLGAGLTSDQPRYSSPYTHKRCKETSESILFTFPDSGTVSNRHGVLVDIVWATSNMINPIEFDITSLEKEMQKKNPFSIKHLRKNSTSKPGMPTTSTEQFLKSLIFVLTGRHRDDIPVTESHIFEQ